MRYWQLVFADEIKPGDIVRREPDTIEHVVSVFERGGFYWLDFARQNPKDWRDFTSICSNPNRQFLRLRGVRYDCRNAG